MHKLSRPSTSQIKLQDVQFLGLCLLVFFMPIARELKNVALATLILSIGFERPSRIWHSFHRPATIEWILLSLVAASLVSTLLSSATPRSFNGLEDVATQAFLFWFLYRHPMSERRMQALCTFIALGVVAGLAVAIWQALSTKSMALEFPDIGINRSAQYAGIGLFVAAALAQAAPGDHNNGIRETLFIGIARLIVLPLAAGLWLLGSRGAILGVVLAALVVFWKKSSRRLLLAASLVMIVAALSSFLLPNVFSQARTFPKFGAILSGEVQPNDRGRIAIWKRAVNHIQSGRDLVFGVGPRKFDSVRDPADANASTYGHAHNWILTKFTEEGLVGLLCFLAFVAWVGAHLYRDSKQRSHWISIAATGALIVPLVAGLFAGRWAKENALIAMLVLGLWAGYYAKQRSTTQDQDPH